MMMIKRLVSVIILTHNSHIHIEKCVKCIDEQNYEKFEIIIVDNNSNDNTRDILANIKTKNSNHKIILNGKNLGYNLGNQVGIDNSKGEFIAFVNPDSFLDKSWLSNIIQVFDSNQNTMIVSGILENIDQTIQSTGGQMDRYGAVKQRKEHIENYFYATGAALVLKQELLKMIKLDPNLFLYYDDVDLSWQTRLLGYEIRFCSNAKSIHIEGHSMQGLSTKKFYFISKNRIYVCLKNYSFRRIISRLGFVLLFVFLDGIYYSKKFKNPSYLFVSIKGMLWNIQNILHLLKQRKKIQSKRVVKDEHIEKHIEKESIEVNTLHI